MRYRPTFTLFIAALFVGSVHAAQWLGWPPKPTSSTAHTPAQPTAAVRLRFAGAAGAREVWIDNDVSGPVEVRVVAASPSAGFPLQRMLPSRGAYLIARVPTDATIKLQLKAVPGASDATPASSSYHYPLLLPEVRIGQAPEGHFSHADVENRHAIDFAAPIGTPVIAARAGTVMQVEDRFSDAPGRLNEANFIRILHDDGSMAIYAHLERGSVEVAAAQRVETGTVLAKSGNSGYSSGPHLHFSVQVNRGMRLESMPVKIETPAGELRLPRTMAQP